MTEHVAPLSRDLAAPLSDALEDLSGLRAFLEQTPRCRAAVLAHNGEVAVKLG